MAQAMQSVAQTDSPGGSVHFTSQRILKLTCKVATMDWGWCLMSVIALFLSYDIITSMCSEEVRNIIR